MGQQWRFAGLMYGAMVTTVWRFPGQEKPGRRGVDDGAMVAMKAPAVKTAPAQHCQR